MKTANEQFFTVYDWMVSELGLSGDEELIYACVYSFSKNSQKLVAPTGYLALRTGCTKRHALRVTDSLVKKGLLKRTPVNTRCYEYVAVCPFAEKKEEKEKRLKKEKPEEENEFPGFDSLFC